MKTAESKTWWNEDATLSRADIAAWAQACLDMDWSAYEAEQAPSWQKRRFYRAVKRSFDVLASGLALILLALPFLGIAIWVYLDDPGPVFFAQTRMGKEGRPFRILKWRSMRQHPEGEGAQVTIGRDPRITRAGHFLRRTKLDELPQLINVFLGQMSLVGSRPEVPQYVACYPEAYRVLLRSRPGITDWSSLRLRRESELLAALAPTAEASEEAYRQELLPAKIWLSIQDRDQRAGSWHDLDLILQTCHIKKPVPAVQLTEA